MMKIDPILYDVYTDMHEPDTLSIQCYCREWIDINLAVNTTLADILKRIDEHESELHADD